MTNQGIIEDPPFVHPTAIVEDGAKLDAAVKVWHFCHVRKGAHLKPGVSIARDVYVDVDTTIGENTRIQNGVSIYKGVSIADWCFVGPHVIFTNDQRPRAGNRNWEITPTILDTGASLGAGAIVRCGVTIGMFAMAGAGAVITKSIEEFTLVTGFPAKPISKICACGQSMLDLSTGPESYLQPCCSQNLDPRLLRIAQIRLRELQNRAEE
ncbi:acyltransferase [Turneriella parva]|uniref:Acetyl / acyl transferase related protein n=1 Tax=Turneriella parva (strain ATCC BAA-1111 / DSM 21527 / NCTC 11395 / H) TaxID=869212 RepID=I4B126_TURPD|nr:acyltransferase [Turneriella parva]AFM10983.1 acetyl / acyl transferase related protein [Turneriella parva DSM 21527]